MLADDNAGTLTKYLNGLGIDNKLRVQTGSTVNYFLTDHLGSTNGLADSSGSLTASTNYDSFGNATNTSFPTRYQYTGREFDSFTGLHYYRARWYDAQLGRFISEDPIGFAGGDVNLYAYVKNNPLNYKDPKGTAIIPILIGGGIALGETGLHRYLHGRSFDKFPGGSQDRERHCYVNCRSVRIHLGNPGMAHAFSALKETGDLFGYAIGYGDHSSWGEAFDDAGKDINANFYGQTGAYMFWRSCEEICSQCPTRR